MGFGFGGGCAWVVVHGGGVGVCALGGVGGAVVVVRWGSSRYNMYGGGFWFQVGECAAAAVAALEAVLKIEKIPRTHTPRKCGKVLFKT